MIVPLTLLLSACLGACPPGQEPGTVVVVGGELQPIAFTLPGGIDFQLSYDPVRLALWFDPDRTQFAPSLTTFQTPSQIAHGDLTGDARIDGDDVQTFVDVLLGNNTDPTLIAQADFDGSGLADMPDLPRFVAALLGMPRNGDVNRDGLVDGEDVQPFVEALLAAGGPSGGDLDGDLNLDGSIDAIDSALFVTVLLGIETDPNLINLSDLNGDGQANGDDIQPFVQAFLSPAPPSPPQNIADADLDFSGIVDLADVPLFVSALLAGVTTQPDTTITLYVEGLVAGTDLCNAPVDLFIDPQGTGTFVDTAQVTVADLTINPQTGGLGTPVTITLTPAIAPLAFDAATTATWTGVYQPIVGPPFAPFTITYSASEFRESSASTAIILVGEGSGLPPLPLQSLPPGGLVGQFTVTVAGEALSRPFDYQIPNSAVKWFLLDYAEDANGYLPLPPTLEPMPLTQLPLWVIQTNASGFTQQGFSEAFTLHTACVFVLDENLLAVTQPPATFTVDLISFDTNGVEMDRVAGVVLTLNPNDGDPNLLTYQTDLSRPIIFFDGTLDTALFPNVILIQTVTNGKIRVRRAAP